MKLFKSKPRLLLPLTLLVLASVLANFYFYHQTGIVKNQLLEKQKELQELQQKSEDDKMAAKAPASIDAILQQAIQEQFADIVPPPASADPNAPDAAGNPGGPAISVAPEVVDLGDISKAKGMASATFKIKSSGGSPLVLQGSFSSCGCTAASLEGQTLAPGKSIDFKVTYDPNYFGKAYGLGPVDKWVMIISNDPRDPFHKVYLRGNVVP